MPFRRFFVALLLTICALTAPLQPAVAQVSWELEQTITSPEKIIDLASSLDGSRIYLLTKDGMVRVYDGEGNLAGTIAVGKNVERIRAVGLQAAGIPERLLVAEGSQVRELSLQFAVKIDIDGAPFLGPADAPITIVEFSDFQCPFCARVKPLIEEVMRRNPDQVKVVFKHFPLPSHQLARPAAVAAMAAQNQGKFWEMHDRIFAAQKELSPAKIRAMAQELQLDMARFDRDINSPEMARRLEKEIADGQQAGVRGTPALFVNGRPVSQRTPEGIQQMIDEILGR
ncbi:DsbA family protein [Desulfurivibrio sp. D14AmB]|uniref:DsbA family protein n=1 Tax=Desulfurivibrio sp. D14AmB TaxID=3374370 RepID=UPI00376EB0DB